MAKQKSGSKFGTVMLVIFLAFIAWFVYAMQGAGAKLPWEVIGSWGG